MVQLSERLGLWLSSLLILERVLEEVLALEDRLGLLFVVFASSSLVLWLDIRLVAID